MTMRVLHVTEALLGGVATYFKEILPVQQARLGRDNVFVLVPTSQTSNLPPDLPLTIATYPVSGRNAMSVLMLFGAILRAIFRFRPDVVHAHSTFAGVAVRLCGLLLLWKRPRIVYCAHGWSFLRDVKPWINRLTALLERLLAYCCDAVTNISYYEYEAALRAGLPASRNLVLRYGLSPANADPGPLLRLDRTCLNCFFIGRHDRQKGLDLLIDAFRNLPPDQYQLYVAGSSVLGDAAAIGDSLPANVHMLGWIDNNKVDAYYRQFDLLLVPSRWEGFGLVVLEAMRNGIPVVSSDRGALPEIVQDGVSGRIFRLAEPGSLATLLLSLTREQLGQMGQSGARRFRDEFSAARMNEETLNLYRKILRVQAPLRAAA